MKLNRDNYFSKEAELKYMGSSSFKAFDIFHGGCEAKQIAKREGRWEDKENPAFLLGSYVHSWSSGDLQKFMSEHPQLFKKDGTLLKKYALGDEMINILKNDPLVQKFREGASFEQIFTGKIAGVDFKIQVDILNLDKGYFVDLKTTKNLSETYWSTTKRGKESFIDKYDYYCQIAIYAEILRQSLGMAEGEYLEPYIIPVDKRKDVPDHAIIDMGTSFIKDKLEEIKTKLPHIVAVREGREEPIACGKCDYCRSIKKAKIITIGEYRESLGLEE